MPSTRKRIGYLPSSNAHETITKIATKENLSQSKVVGILVEEALVARNELGFRSSNSFTRNHHHSEHSNMDKSSFNYNDPDALISDKGITYNTKKYKHDSEANLIKSEEKYNEELFEQFKQFIMFQKMTQYK